MSTHIYVAYRLKKRSDLWAFVQDAQAQATANMRVELEKLYHKLMGDQDRDDVKYQKLLESYKDEWAAAHSLAHDAIRQKYREQLGSGYRNDFDFDVTLGIWQWKGRLYIIPFCDMLMRNVLDFLKDDERLEDFSYWNNTDRPEHISNAQWRGRERVWYNIDEAGWHDQLSLVICSWLDFPRVDPWYQMADEHREEKRKALEYEDKKSETKASKSKAGKPEQKRKRLKNRSESRSRTEKVR